MKLSRSIQGLARVVLSVTAFSAMLGFAQAASANDEIRFNEALTAFDEAKSSRDHNHEAYQRAFKIWQELQSAGDKRATYHVGMMHMFGLGGAEFNQQLGVQEIRRAAEDGYPVAQSFMGFLIETGDGTFVRNGDKAAFEWWHKGAMGNHCAGIRRMIRVYANGELSVNADSAKAAEWKAKEASCNKR